MMITDIELAEHPMTSRSNALRLAREVLAFLDTDTEDLLVVADWLLTGQANLALKLADVRARHWRGAQVPPDSARWIPGDDGGEARD